MAAKLGVCWQGENPLVFFALMLHLMDMFVLSPSLGNVTRAVSSRSQTLVQTAGLAFIMVPPRIPKPPLISYLGAISAHHRRACR